jgi:hypothetical protein
MLKPEDRDDVRSIIKIQNRKDSDDKEVGSGLGYIIICLVTLAGVLYLLSLLWEKLHQFCWTFGLY